MSQERLTPPIRCFPHVLSPCGRYLAVGSAVGEEFDDGGVLQIWEVATGRCVNVIDRIPGLLISVGG
ncbi:hypothetical protein ABZ897_59480 [Nonomuraea sp. NPDC046802]|uniref:hypothetical protein n=1 Tax=Nonomuraea sp. NPDC046802 TaxID=3154919 RepID=UPI0034072745